MPSKKKTASSADTAPDVASLAAPVIECAPLAMVEVEGPDHVVCFVNPAFCRLLNKRREDLLGKPFSAIVRQGDRCVPLLDRVYRTGAFETHVEADHTADAPNYWLYAMWPALGAGERPERVVIQLTKAADSHPTVAAMNEALLISGLRQHELREAAEKSNARLESEVAERQLAVAALCEANAKLKLAQAAAERASQAKDNFFATLSHELRTPLAPVLLTAAALREDERLPEDVREQLAMMERNVTLEARLIDDLLDLTRISHGKLQLRLQPCDAPTLIQFAIEIVRNDADAKAITIESTLEAVQRELTGDPTRLQQVIWNLLRNAVRFTPSGGKISIHTRDIPAADGTAWLQIEITDTGIGIEPARLEEIFQPFDQGGATDENRQGGLGLGLYIARAVVERHRGQIGARSDGPNRGSTFFVRLPIAKSVAPRHQLHDGVKQIAHGAAKAGLPAQKLAPLRLLVVEDHGATLDALAWLLRRDGHTVVTAATATAALNTAAAERFDCVISDLGLPDGSGVHLMETLRATYDLKGVALTGYGMEADLHRSSEAGFIAHLVKPVAIADLRRVIASVQVELKQASEKGEPGFPVGPAPRKSRPPSK